MNVYNRLKYSNDPTILAWETGNELGGARPTTVLPLAAADLYKGYIGAEGCGSGRPQLADRDQHFNTRL